MVVDPRPRFRVLYQERGTWLTWGWYSERYAAEKGAEIASKGGKRPSKAEEWTVGELVGEVASYGG